MTLRSFRWAGVASTLSLLISLLAPAEHLLAQGGRPHTGACCATNATGSLVCVVVSAADCATLGGTYRGDFTDCSGPNPCPQAPRGACCLPQSPGAGGRPTTCMDYNEIYCRNQGGTYQGNGTTCRGFTCPPPPTPTGSCCFSNGSCLVLTRAACQSQSGIYRGNGTNCATTICPGAPRGACCLPGGSQGGIGGGGAGGGSGHGSAQGPCSFLSEAECNILGGTYRGNGSDCRTANCPLPPPPTGACCFSNGSCLVLSRDDCRLQRGIYQGNATNCATTNCPGAPRGACCLPLGSQGNPGGGGGRGGTQQGPCMKLTHADCNVQGGVYQGDGTDCRNANCPIYPPGTGACCVIDAAGNPLCVQVSSTVCGVLGGTFRGVGTSCTTTNCRLINCWCDWDHDGQLTQADEIAFLNDFANGNADINQDGFTNGLDHDLFYTCYLQGC